MFQWDGTKGPGLANKRTNAFDHRGCLVDMIQVGTIGMHLAAHLIMTRTEHHVIAGIANYKGHAGLESSVVIFAPGKGSLTMELKQRKVELSNLNRQSFHAVKALHSWTF